MLTFDPVASALQPLDMVAIEYESKWGAGVLPTLVTAELRDKFRRAQQRLDEAISGNDYDTVKGRAEALIRGWHSLEAEAIKNGHSPDKIDGIHKAVCPDGVTYFFCDEKTTAQRFVARNPKYASCTLTFVELAHILQAYSVAYGGTTNDKAGYFTGPHAIKGDNTPMINDSLPF